MGVEWLKGRVCTRVTQNYPENVTFQFGEGELSVDCLWRVEDGSRIVITSRDHGQQFGLPARVDSCGAAMSLLNGRSVLNIRLDERTADLTVEFEGGQQLHILVDSSGHEPWNLTGPGVHVVALGGGGVAEFPIAVENRPARQHSDSDAIPLTEHLRARVLLSLQRAIVGEITPEMLAVTVYVSPTTVQILLFLVDGSPAKLAEDFDAGAVTQVVADFCWPERGDPVIVFDWKHVSGGDPVCLPEGFTAVFAPKGVNLTRPTA